MALRAAVCELDFASSVLRGGRVRRRGAWLSDGRGYGWLGPWESLGEKSVEFHLSEYQAGRTTRLFKRALEMMSWTPKQVTRPESAHLVTTESSLSQSAAQVVKLKVSPQDSVDVINSWFERAPPGTLLRLDANNQFATPQEFLKFWSGLSTHLQEAVEFVEEAVPYSPEAWAALAKQGLRLALDRDLDRYVAGDESVTHFVVKPLVHDLKFWSERAAVEMKRVVVSHNMDPDLAFDYSVDLYWQLVKIHPLLLDTPGLGLWHQGITGLGSTPGPELAWQELGRF